MAYSCKTLEPPPEKIFPIGTVLLSPGGSFAYKIASYPFCRIYWGEGKPEPNAYESAWYKDDNGKWRKDHPNFVSYYATVNDSDTIFELTVNDFFREADGEQGC